ncbi:hypothetical protein N9H77_01405 [Porticoccaceae bacterium]|nr:hypothetical protein [Porticoccaceae bacterium]
MPAPSARIGDTIITGHACSATSTIISSLQAKVIVSFSIAAVTGSPIAPHTILAGDKCIPHPATTLAGSPKVFFGGIPANRIGDGADMGAIISGAPNVIIGP